jgi:hypothetical protein
VVTTGAPSPSPPARRRPLCTSQPDVENLEVDNGMEQPSPRAPLPEKTIYAQNNGRASVVRNTRKGDPWRAWILLFSLVFFCCCLSLAFLLALFGTSAAT